MGSNITSCPCHLLNQVFSVSAAYRYATKLPDEFRSQKKKITMTPLVFNASYQSAFSGQASPIRLPQ